MFVLPVVTMRPATTPLLLSIKEGLKEVSGIIITTSRTVLREGNDTVLVPQWFFQTLVNIFTDFSDSTLYLLTSRMEVYRVLLRRWYDSSLGLRCIALSHEGVFLPAVVKNLTIASSSRTFVLPLERPV